MKEEIEKIQSSFNHLCRCQKCTLKLNSLLDNLIKKAKEEERERALKLLYSKNMISLEIIEMVTNENTDDC